MRRLAALVLWPGALFAQEQEAAIYGPLLDQCYAAATTAQAKSACSGIVFDACTTQEDGGQTTLGMTACAYAEAQVWDKWLNAEYAETIAAFTAQDADERVYFPEFANRVTSLRDAQRAWIAFRDAECGLAYAQWGSGSMRHIAGSSCVADMTAERTIELFQMRESF